MFHIICVNTTEQGLCCTGRAVHRSVFTYLVKIRDELTSLYCHASALLVSVLTLNHPEFLFANKRLTCRKIISYQMRIIMIKYCLAHRNPKLERHFTWKLPVTTQSCQRLQSFNIPTFQDRFQLLRATCLTVVSNHYLMVDMYNITISSGLLISLSTRTKTPFYLFTPLGL